MLYSFLHYKFFVWLIGVYELVLEALLVFVIAALVVMAMVVPVVMEMIVILDVVLLQAHEGEMAVNGSAFLLITLL